MKLWRACHGRKTFKLIILEIFLDGYFNLTSAENFLKLYVYGTSVKYFHLCMSIYVTIQGKTGLVHTWG